VPSDRRFDRSNCAVSTLAGVFGTDQRQIFNFTTVMETPRFANNIVRTAATGWKTALIWRYSSGGYLTPTISTGDQVSGTGGLRADQILPNPLCATPNNTCWINPKAFTAPLYGTLNSLTGNTLPNAGRASIPGPDFWQIDMSLSRVFRVREGKTLELRGDAFNLTNSFRAGVASGASAGAGGVTTTENSAQFGQILNALDPRILQVAAKFVF